MSSVAASTLSEARRNESEVPKVALNSAPFDDFGLLTLATVAKLLHCSKAHVSNVIAGRIHDCPPIPAVRLGRRRLVRREALAAWVERIEAANVNLNPSPERGRKNA
jgi:excisionase family DNA binding protein